MKECNVILQDNNPVRNPSKEEIKKTSEKMMYDLLRNIRVPEENKDLYIQSFLEVTSSLVDLYDDEEKFNQVFFKRVLHGHDVYFLRSNHIETMSNMVKEIIIENSNGCIDKGEINRVVSAFEKTIPMLGYTKYVHTNIVKRSEEIHLKISEIPNVVEEIIINALKDVYSLINPYSEYDGPTDLVESSQVEVMPFLSYSSRKALKVFCSKVFLEKSEDDLEAIINSIEESYESIKQKTKEILLRNNSKRAIANPEEKILSLNVSGVEYELFVSITQEYDLLFKKD